MATPKAVTSATSKYAAKVRTQLTSASTSSVLDNVWTSRLTFLLYNLAVPLAFYFKPLCVLFALLWLILRASKILLTPLPILSTLLGFDIPPAPLLSLASIGVDGCILHWTVSAGDGGGGEKPKHKGQLKYEIYLNGSVIDSVGVGESAVVLSGLQPGGFYVVRVGLVFGEICSKSQAVRFRTKSVSAGADGGEDSYAVGVDGHETDNEGVHHASMPRVRPYRALKDFTPATPTSASMTREPSAGLSGGKTGSRRPSPAALGIDADAENPFTKAEAPMEPSSTIQELTAKLEGYRRENDELEKQAKNDEEDDLRQKEELTKERDTLRNQFTDREKASKALRKDIGAIERANTLAQNEKTKVERALQSKKAERKKMQTDMVRWEQEAERMKVDVERIQKEQREHVEEKAGEKKVQQGRLEEEIAELRALDERVKAKNAEVKAIERAIRDAEPSAATGAASTSPEGGQETPAPEPTILQQQQAEAEEDKKWLSLRTTLQQQYSIAFNKLNAAKRFHAEQYQYLESLRAERRRQDESMVREMHASPTVLSRVPQRGDSRRSRTSISDSPRLGAFQVGQAQPPFPSNTTGPAGGFNRFFNYSNGMTLNANNANGPTNEIPMSDDDRLQLTGGAAMSPSAGADLIPADLFSGDGDSRPEHVQILPGLGSLPNLPGLPGLPGAGGGGPYAAQSQTQPPQEQAGGANGPASPAASSSRSASVFASPQASQPNLILGPVSPDMTIDPDRRSIRSTRSTRAPSGGATTTGSRFSGMFGIKQRKQNVADGDGGVGGVPLSKASSMPRQDHILSGLDSASRKRNSSLSGPAFGNVDGALEGTAGTPEGSAGAAPRRGFGLFGKDKGIIGGGWPSTFTAFGRRPVSPRPGSTHSTELPRPSLEAGSSGGRWGADAWPSNDASVAGAKGSPLAFGDGWNVPTTQQSRLFGSRHPSRRPSVQYGASGPPDDILEGDDDDYDYEDADPDVGKGLAPIGTKPSKKAENTAKLNPNAKDFKSFFKFGGGKDKEKNKEVTTPSDQEGAATLQTSSSTTSNLAPSAGTDNEESPPHSRKSRDTRDTRSITTAGETSSLAESGGRNSPDLVRTPSYSNSDVAAGAAGSPNLQAKESFMAKITRKSSSSKFSLPTFARQKSRLDASLASNTSTPTPAEEEEAEAGGMEESVGSLNLNMRDVTSTPREIKDVKEIKDGGSLTKTASRSWSSAFKLGKKKGVENSSLSSSGDRVSGNEDGDEESEDV